MAEESIIKSINPGARVRDALHKPDPEKKRKPARPRAETRKKEPKHIIDTYA